MFLPCDPTNYNIDLTTPGYMEKLFQSLGVDFALGEYQGRDAYRISCPYHPDPGPSCRVYANGLGGFNCFGCKKTGTLSDLVAHVRGIAGPTSRQEALQYIASLNGYSQYIDPFKNCVKVYEYRDRHGFVVKLKRFKGYDEPGGKIFDQTQRKPGGGFKWKDLDEKALYMLHNLDKLQFVDTVVVVEGEKAADSVNAALKAWGLDNYVVATTSGDAGTWRDKFIADLERKKIIILPDSDVAGQDYANNVLNTCIQHGLGTWHASRRMLTEWSTTT